MVKVELEESSESEEVDNVFEVLFIDWEQLINRFWQVLVSFGNYSDLIVNVKYFYVRDQVIEFGSKLMFKVIE